MIPLILLYFAYPMVLGSQHIETHTVPIPGIHCQNIQCARLTCGKTFTPKGACCPICACIDKSGESVVEGMPFLSELQGTSICLKCHCIRIDGMLEAKCSMPICPKLKCKHQYQPPDSCCAKCKQGQGMLRTFPPFPFPVPGGFPKFPKFPKLPKFPFKKKREMRRMVQ